MRLENAKLFIKTMKEDNTFRKQISEAANNEIFWELVKRENFNFDGRHLAGAMAECMTEGEIALYRAMNLMSPTTKAIATTNL